VSTKPPSDRTRAKGVLPSPEFCPGAPGLSSGFSPKIRNEPNPSTANSQSPKANSYCAPGLSSGFSPKIRNEPNPSTANSQSPKANSYFYETNPICHPTIHCSLFTIHYFTKRTQFTPAAISLCTARSYGGKKGGVDKSLYNNNLGKFKVSS